MRQPATHPSPRDGFTLIELLVVIAILTLLAAMTVSGISMVKSGQQSRITDDTVTKLQTGMNSQMKTVIEEATKDNNQFLPLVMPFCDNDKDRAKALLAYAYTMREFPQSFAEARYVVPIGPGIPPHKAFNSISSNMTPSGVSPAEESAILLYLILQEKGNRGQVMPVDDSTSNAQMTIQTAIGPFKVFKDAYGTPIAFRRWFGSIPPAVSAVNPNELQQAPFVNNKSPILDPLDPIGKLATWTNAANKATALSALGLPGFDGMNKLNVVISAGYDTNFGPYFGGALADGQDDILGYRLVRFGTKGN